MSAAVRAGPGATARQGLHYLAVSVLLFGGIWPITKAALAHATPLWFALNRCALAALVTTALLALLRRLRADPRTADLPVIVFVPSDDEERWLREQYPDRTWCLRKPLTMTALDAARRAFDPSGSGVQPVPDAV